MKEILITSSILILVLAGLRLILRGHIKACLQYALWILVAVRLLIPIQFGSLQFSAANLANRAEPSAQLTQRQLVGPSYEEAKRQITAEYQQLAAPPVLTEAVLEQEIHSRMTGPTIGEFLLGVWLFGAFATGVWFFATNLMFWKRARKNAQPIFMQGCPVPVYVTQNVPSPCLVGFVQPKIYLTPACLENRRQLCHVLRHELTHLQHKDNWWSLVRCICLCLYWFHPLVWAAAALSRRDCELACDESALAKLGEGERLAYGRTLLHLVTQQQTFGLVQTATTMTESKRQLKERIMRIAKQPKQAAAAVAVTVLAAAIAVGCTFSGGVKNTQNKAQTSDAASENIFSVRFVPPRIENLSTGNLPCAIRITPDFSRNTADGFSSRTSAHVFIRDGSLEGDYLLVELYEKYSINSREKTLLATKKQPLETNSRDVFVDFDLDKAQCKGYSYTYQVSFCRADDTVLERKESQDILLPSQFSLPLYSSNRIKLSEITLYPNKDFDFYVPLSSKITAGSNIQFSSSDPQIAEVEKIESTTNTQWFRIHSIREGSATVTIQFDDLTAPLTVHVDKNAPVVKNPRFSENAVQAHYCLNPFTVEDTSGNNIAIDLVDLWYACNEFYSPTRTSQLDEDSMESDSAMSDYRLLDHYGQVIDSIFTANGRKQLEQAKYKGQPVFTEINGVPYRMSQDSLLSYPYAVALQSMEVKKAEENRLVLTVWYISSMLTLDGETKYASVDFTVVKEDGVWMVDNYCNPSFSY